MVPCSTWAPAAPARARTTATAKRARTTPLHMEASVMDYVMRHHHGRTATLGSRDQSRPRQTDFGRGGAQRWAMPRLSAAITAWVRSLTPSLPRMLVMCPLTVGSVIARSFAISLLLL